MMKIEFPASFCVRENVPLSEYTSLKIGGPAAYVAPIRTPSEGVELYQCCRCQGLSFFPLGQGTNVFFSEKGFSGLVALFKLKRITVGPGERITAEAGAALSEVNKTCTAQALTGFEFTAGIPGTVGGALFGNAGAYGNAVGDCLSAARILTVDGEVKWVGPDFFQFSYRHSRLKTDPVIVLQAEFQLAPGVTSEIEAKVEEILTARKRKLPLPEVATAGCFFKNPRDEQGRPTAAAIYLEAVGSKQISVGDAAVHPQHANIFFNKGQATAQDFFELERILKERVRERFGIQLEREVMFIPCSQTSLT